MTSIINTFINLDDLNKTKSTINSNNHYKKNAINLNTNTPALSQGDKFKKYQKKIKQKLNNHIADISDKEGFQGLPGLTLSSNGLTEQSNKIIEINDNIAKKQSNIDELQNEYQNTMTQYEDLLSKINNKTNSYVDRVSSNNPYLGKNVCLSNGACGYVTHQGVFKWYPADNNYTYSNTAGKNGCPSTPYIQINGSGNINAVGSTISSNPPLIVGTPMTAGQSCGSEGENVYVNQLVNKSQSSYLGCYNNIDQPTNILFVPSIPSSNTINNFTSSASSVYQNNNGFCGPFHAFDNNKNDYWHSSTDSSHLYNSSNGNYTGKQKTNYIDANGNNNSVSGEWLEIDTPAMNNSGNNGYVLTKYDVQGRQDCCGNPNGRTPNSWLILGYLNGSWHLVDQQTNTNMNYDMQTFITNNTNSYQGFRFVITNCGNPGDKSGSRYCVQISIWNLYTSSSSSNNSQTAMNNVGNMSYQQCEKYSLLNGFKYFGFQNINTDGTGNCMVSNDLTGTQIYGQGLELDNLPLWNSNTVGTGFSALVNNSGSIVVNNSSGSSVFASDATNTTPSNYIGCYNDCSGGRALPTYITVGSNAGSTYQSCAAAASSGNWAYFGLQFTQPNGTSECWVGNDLNKARSQGKASNCTVVNGNSAGGGCSNAVYSTNNPTSYYYLILQDDGNMVMYRGTGPNDNQGLIWSTGTNGKTQDINPNFTAAKSKYGRNYIMSGETLQPNEFVGSTNGNMYLIMQTDGNLVLYTSGKGTACKKKPNGPYQGKNNVNAVYQNLQLGNLNNLGQLAYIDADSKLHTYPNNNIQYSNKYTKINGLNSAGYDIPGAAYGNATIEKCKTSCNNNSECGGFAYTSDNVCWPKYNSMYPNGSSEMDSNVDLYIRNKKPLNANTGVSYNTNNTDSLTYQNYIQDNSEPTNLYSLANATSVERQQLEQLQTKMNLLSNQITNLTNKFGNRSKITNNQATNNVSGIKDYLKEIAFTNKKINGFNENINNILQDSDIVVLQKNYDYLFWTILATGALLVSINIVKK
jgi:archaellum component FlaC